MGGRPKLQTPPTLFPPPLPPPAPKRCPEQSAPPRPAPRTQTGAPRCAAERPAPGKSRVCSSPPPWAGVGLPSPALPQPGKVRSPPVLGCCVTTFPFPKAPCPRQGPCARGRTAHREGVPCLPSSPFLFRTSNKSCEMPRQRGPNCNVPENDPGC